MNLDLLSTVLNTLMVNGSNEAPLTAILGMTEALEQGINLKQGQNVVISIENGGLTLGLSGQDKQNIVLNPQTLILDRSIPQQQEEALQIEAKVANIQNGNAKLQIIRLNDMPPQQYIRSQVAVSQPSETAAVIRDTSTLPQVSFAETNIISVAEPYINRQPLPESLKDVMRQIFSQVGVKLELGRLGTAPQAENIQDTPTSTVTAQLTSKIAQAVDAVTQKLSVTPEVELTNVIRVETQNVKVSLQELVGNTLPALVNAENNGRPVFASVLGNLFPEADIQLPKNLAADLNIVDIITYSPEKKITELRAPQDVIRLSLQKLRQTQPELYDKIITKLPSSGEKMLSNMVAFVKASAKGDIR